jgi:hypothetical protein
MHTVSYAEVPTHQVSKPRRTRRHVQRHLELEPLEDRRLLSGASSISFTFSFNLNQIVNSIPSVVPFTVTFTSSFTNAAAGSAASFLAGTSSSQVAAAQNAATPLVFITPISPSVFSSSAEHDGEEPVVILFFTPQTVVHLGASSAPATGQRARAVSVEQEMPSMTAGNMFGQSLFDTVSGMANPTLVPATAMEDSAGTSLIDLVEPLEPGAPVNAPKALENKAAPAKDAAPKPAPAPQANPKADATTAQLPSLELDEALAMMSAAPELGPTPQDQAIASASDSTPKLVGAAAIAIGGYHLLYGQRDRFRDGRFRTGSRRWLADGSRFEPSMN